MLLHSGCDLSDIGGRDAKRVRKVRTLAAFMMPGTMNWSSFTRKERFLQLLIDVLNTLIFGL